VSGQYTRDTVLDHFACVRTGLPRSRWLRKRWTERERATFEASRDQLRSSPLHYEDVRRLHPVGELAASVRHLRESHGLGLVVIDNATWFAETANPARVEEGANAVGQVLHDASSSMSVPVIACCPVPWDMSGEEVKAPTQADLGPYIPILEHCAACFTVHYRPLGGGPKRQKILSVHVEFHTEASRGDISFHCLDTRSFRIRDWA